MTNDDPSKATSDVPTDTSPAKRIAPQELNGASNFAANSTELQSTDEDLEDERLPDLPFDTLSKSVLTQYAWWILLASKRVKFDGPRVERVSTRRMAAAMLMFGLEFSSEPSSATWLVERSPFPRDRIRQRLRDLYPQIGAQGFFSQEEDRSGVRMSPTLSKVLRNAGELAHVVRAQKIAARHLLAAVLVQACADENNNIARFLRGFGIDATPTLHKLVEDVKEWGIDDDVNAFRDILGRSMPRSRDGSSSTTSTAPERKVELKSPDSIHRPLADQGIIKNGYARLDPDNPEGVDKLDITNDINAMAKMLAAWRLQPPLSVGLFGEWGSGKTFFMTKLRKAVAELSKASRMRTHTFQREEAYCKYIAQVEFNAWHYSEGDLWAAMVSHIFANLRLTDDDSATELANRTKAAIAVLKARAADAQQKVGLLKESEQEVVRKQQAKTDAEKKAQAAEAELHLTGHDLVKALKDDPSLQRRAKNLLNQAGLDANALQTAEEVNSALQNAQRDGVNAIQFFKQLYRDLLQRPVSTLVTYGAVFGLPFVMACLLNRANSHMDWASSLTKQLLSIAPAVIALAGYMSQVSQRLSRVLDEPRRQIRQEWDERVKSLAAQVQAAQSERDQAQRAADDAANRVREARLELESLTPQRLLAGFLAEREGSSDYREKLGLLALVRSDFERLSKLMMEQRLSDEKATEIKPLNKDDLCLHRIILYIDDLDRCPPDRVVKVLQAIHLLLAFPLFIVVVGVDARWVQRSLRTQYRLLLSGEAELEGSRALAGASAAESNSGDAHQMLKDGLDGQETIATPRDYLEKIFQIPLWLRTLSTDLKRDLVASLVQDDMVTQGSSVPSTSPKAPDREVDATMIVPLNALHEEPEAVANRESTISGTNPNGSSQQVISQTSPSEPDGINNRPAQIDHLRLEDNEIGVMKQLAPLYGRSPRSIKRYVNCYRLFKSMEAERLAAATKSQIQGSSTSVASEVALLFLAIIVGAPMTARRLVDVVADRKNDKLKMVAVLRTVSPDDASPETIQERQAVEPFISLVPSECDVETARDLIFRIWRFSFRSAEPGKVPIFEPETNEPQSRESADVRVMPRRA